MSWISRVAGIVVLGGLTAAPSMAAQVFVGVGPRVVVARPAFVRPYPFYYGYYGPVYGYGYPYYYAGYPAGPAAGEVKIDTHWKDASVYVDGGYVGPINKFKKFWLTSGLHNIELKEPSGRSLFQERVQVLVNRTVEIRPPA
jgi:hypothetical protein